MFEFRVFGEILAEQRTALESAFKYLDEEHRTDLYLLGRNSCRSYKLRGFEALELKDMTGTQGKYEIWNAKGSCDLPAPGAAVAKAFRNADDLPVLPPADILNAKKLGGAFVRQGFKAAPVQKFRTRYSHCSCRAEATRVVVGDRPEMWTVAVEGEDIAELDRLRETLLLTGFDNVNYPDWLNSTFS